MKEWAFIICFEKNKKCEIALILPYFHLFDGSYETLFSNKPEIESKLFQPGWLNNDIAKLCCLILIILPILIDRVHRLQASLSLIITFFSPGVLVEFHTTPPSPNRTHFFTLLHMLTTDPVRTSLNLGHQFWSTSTISQAAPELPDLLALINNNPDVKRNKWYR